MLLNFFHASESPSVLQIRRRASASKASFLSRALEFLRIKELPSRLAARSARGNPRRAIGAGWYSVRAPWCVELRRAAAPSPTPPPDLVGAAVPPGIWH